MSVNHQAPPKATVLERLAVDFGSEVPIYTQVKNQLRLHIERGELASGEQLPTELPGKALLKQVELAGVESPHG